MVLVTAAICESVTMGTEGRQPFRIDWVIGDVNARIPEVFRFLCGFLQEFERDGRVAECREKDTERCHRHMPSGRINC